jgi:hypothetical protein
MSGFEVQAVAPGVFRVGMFGDGRPADYDHAVFCLVGATLI